MLAAYYTSPNNYQYRAKVYSGYAMSQMYKESKTLNPKPLESKTIVLAVLQAPTMAAYQAAVD